MQMSSYILALDISRTWLLLSGSRKVEEEAEDFGFFLLIYLQHFSDILLLML